MNSPSGHNPNQGSGSDSGEAWVSGGQAVFAGSALGWIGSGWNLFTKSPGIWVVNMLILFVLWIASVFIPIVGGIAWNLLTPVILGGVMLGCRALDDGEPLRVEHLFAGFKDKVGPLMLVGLFQMIGAILAIVVIVVVMLATYGGAIWDAFGDSGGFSNLFRELGLSMVLLMMGVSIALFLPLAMACWFAPALVVFHDLDTLEAMKQSFLGCVRNIPPGIVYFIVSFVLCIIGAVPILLGLLVVAPILFGAVYTAYKDIYLPK